MSYFKRFRHVSALALLAGITLFASACSEDEDPEVQIEELVVGTGDAAQVGDSITVHYTGKLAANQQTFDTTVGADPAKMWLKEGRLIQGWIDGIPGMKVGGKRRLTIPSELAYGNQGFWNAELEYWIIPPGATLMFDIELVGVKKN